MPNRQQIIPQPNNLHRKRISVERAGGERETLE